MAETEIEWARNADGTKGRTWNPVTGCTKVSPGCAHCYAETFAERWRGTPGHPYEQGFDLRLWPNRLQQPSTWRKPTTVFVNSMSDLFHEDIPKEYILRVFRVMQANPQHTFQVLTKRPERMVALTRETWPSPSMAWTPNIWAGVSVENQRWTSRISELVKVPSSVHFLSCEPLLGPLELDLEGIQWVIGGGESGAQARPCDPAWARSLRDQCAQAAVPFFWKQWGAWGPDGVRRSKKANDRLLDGTMWDQMPERVGLL